MELSRQDVITIVRVATEIKKSLTAMGIYTSLEASAGKAFDLLKMQREEDNKNAG